MKKYKVFYVRLATEKRLEETLNGLSAKGYKLVSIAIDSSSSDYTIIAKKIKP